MASSTLQKLLRSRTLPASAFFSHFHKPLSPSPSLALTQIPKPNDHTERDHFNPNHSFCGQVYPTFSFEFLLNPTAPPPLIRPESDAEADEGSVIRADSVKKKRKRKMNKHKMKKMKKLLRRKT